MDALNKLNQICEEASTYIEARDNCIYAKDIGEMRGMVIAEFNTAIPRCYSNVALFVTARQALPALVELVEKQQVEIAAQKALNKFLGGMVHGFCATLEQMGLEADMSQENSARFDNLTSATDKTAVAVDSARAKLEEVVCTKQR